MALVCFGHGLEERGGHEQGFCNVGATAVLHLRLRGSSSVVAVAVHRLRVSGLESSDAILCRCGDGGFRRWSTSMEAGDYEEILFISILLSSSSLDSGLLGSDCGVRSGVVICSDCCLRCSDLLV